MILDPENLPKWRIVQSARGDFNVLNENGAIIFANLPEADAVLACAGPKVVKFMLTCFDNRHPCRVDVGRVLGQCGIDFEDTHAPAPAVE